MPHQVPDRRRFREDSDDEDDPSFAGLGNEEHNEYTNGVEKLAFQPGSVVRVSITDFLTYERADFFPGPSLNMVIGPNGTGKSSLVCAICLGLGYLPAHLGRADDLKSFIAHEKEFSIIEIELKGQSDQHVNHIIKSNITKDDKRRWWINGKNASLPDVKKLMNKLSIQIDNLCQFLPQDKVSEFSGMNPKELLHSTQRAASPPEMLEWHDQLIEFRKQEKKLQLSHETNQAHLKSNREKRDALQGDVDKLADVEKSEKEIELLRKARVFIEYKARRVEFQDLKAQKKDAQTQLKRLQRRVEPTLQAISEKQTYQRDIQAVEKERHLLVKKAERDIATVVQELQTADEKIKDIDNTRDSEHKADTTRRQEITKHQRKIGELTARQQHVVEFDAADWNRRIREEEKAIKELNTQLTDLKGQHDNVRSRGGILRQERTNTETQLEVLDSQAGQQLNRLSRASSDAAKLYEWIQSHQDEFEKPVYGPPLLECRIKGGCEQYLASVEACVNREVVLSFTTQTKNDYRKLSEVMRGNLRLSDVFIKTSYHPLASYGPPVDQETMRTFGLQGFALDFLEGPEPVLAMMCSTTKLHQTGITLRNISDAQQNQLVGPESPITSFVAGGTSFRIVRRPEYGDLAVSTSAQNVGPAKFWTAYSVDTSATQELQAKIDDCVKQFEVLKQRNVELRESISNVDVQIKDRDKVMKQLQSDKGDLQRAYNEWKNLPNLIVIEQQTMKKRIQAVKESQEKAQNLSLEKSELVLSKAALAFEYKDKFARLQKSQEQLLEAQIWLLEATSDCEALTEENQDITIQLRDAEALLQQLTNNAEDAKRKAKRMMALCQDINDRLDPESEEKKRLDDLGETCLEADLDAMINAEKVFIETNSNAVANPQARADHKKYSDNVTKYENQSADSAEQLETLATQIAEVKQKWEPALDKLIATISAAFSYNFEQIGCAGEVGVHKADDFDEWALEIKVKFREEESLQLLDIHRQSGGERSVSTIFYLMSLQSLALAPFRVVDEINQGMDPRNERMVHERMVEIACEEHTSQYFLITPKLLPNLRYDPRMRVLCIASGEYMPQNHETVSVKKAIAIRKALIAAR